MYAQIHTSTSTKSCVCIFMYISATTIYRKLLSSHVRYMAPTTTTYTVHNCGCHGCKGHQQSSK